MKDICWGNFFGFYGIMMGIYTAIIFVMMNGAAVLFHLPTVGIGSSMVLAAFYLWVKSNEEVSHGTKGK